MRVTCDTPICSWQPAFGRNVDRRGLAALLHGGGDKTLDRVVAAGHQAWLWHPGILAKNLAVSAAARRFDAVAVHIVVDHDAHEATRLALPVVQGDRLLVHEVSLDDDDPQVPTGCRPPADVQRVVGVLHDAIRQLGPTLAVDLQPIIDAYEQLGQHRTLAEQTAAVVEHLSLPYTGPMAWMFSSSLGQFARYNQLIERMVSEADSCVESYNRAVNEHPGAGVAPLLVERQRVELPLWLLEWQRPRRRVFADLTGSKPALVSGDGRSIDRQAILAPKALLLTTVMRALVCDFFIHGQGGAVYDQVTERWCRDWLDRELSPRATVSADVLLSFDVPMAQRMDLERALWRCHHLPHNLDRELGLSGPTVRRKRDLIVHMGDDHDATRRYQAFEAIHRINGELATEHRDILEQAQQELWRTRIGVSNRQFAVKRDWCFGLYPSGQLRKLAEVLS